ncbi:F-box domain-containing protein [Colletotrichum higginsianum IMI 349063]|uniref:F-box domain-containing protein n=1 Tax=Colletotrichum higginsianum (strain IMI 349063) TaxID=759273 RepID=A0A1B7Y7F0_COLHI|nr:F-box domain-containing protein [Colletotrichum higginsianum IMI 349063]OBR07982.1 F-box domain-containing protein [Colletotrichum higginsianum IMI 349063]
MTATTPTTPPDQHLPHFSQFSAALFSRLPPEIRLEILSHCQQNDLICLSLSSHYFRNLTSPLIPSKPSLLSCDQNVPQETLACSCGNDRVSEVVHNVDAHRRKRHSYIVKRIDHGDGLAGSNNNNNNNNNICMEGWPCRTYPPQHEMCRRPWCKHCACISCPLYTRLRGWMGQDRRYCSVCRTFTKRAWTKKYNGRCLHGRPKVRKASNNHWTAKKGQSYGYRWWRRWGTSGVDCGGYGGNYEEGDPLSLQKRRNPRVV